MEHGLKNLGYCLKELKVVGEEEDKVVASLGYVQGVEQSMDGELQTIVVCREIERERER